MQLQNKIFFGLLLASQTCLIHAGVMVDMDSKFFSKGGSGSIGEFKTLNYIEWELSLKDDNDNHSLPDTFRTWFYVHFTQFGDFAPVTLLFNKFGFNTAFNPVYSYDNKKWYHFADNQIKWQCDGPSPDTCNLSINKQFTHKNFWIARFNPYTIVDARECLNALCQALLKTTTKQY
jgi:hypothetical protein